MSSTDKLAQAAPGSDGARSSARGEPNPFAVMRLSSISPRRDSVVPLKITTPMPMLPVSSRPVDVVSASNAKAVVAEIVAAAAFAKKDKDKDARARSSSIAGSATAASSFRVYSPADVATMPIRPGYRPAPVKSFSEEVKETLAVARAASPKKLAKWIASASLALFLFFVFILVVANASDDTLAVTTPKATSADSPSSALPPPPPPPQLAAPAASSAPPPDFELPSDAPPQRTAAKPRSLAPK